MARQNHFVIRNDALNALILNVEPEGVVFRLGRGEEVSVQDEFTIAPVTVKFATSAQGDTIVSIWPGDGVVRVEKDGEDIFDLVQSVSLSDPLLRHHELPTLAEPIPAVT
jgi:hypothetical protein